MRVKFLHHHLGLGDHFCCNGLVLELIRRWQVDKLFLFCWSHNFNTLRKLYQGTCVELVPLAGHNNEDAQVTAFLAQRGVPMTHNGPIDWLTGSSGSYFKLGFSWMENDCHRGISQSVSCDQCFYLQAKVPYEMRFDGFSYSRNLSEEEEAYNRLNPTGEPYIFVAIDDPARGMIAPSRNCIQTDLLVIENPRDISIFSLGKILENAKEVHLMESSIRCLIEARKVYDMSRTKLFLHAWRGCIWGNNSLLSWELVWQDCSREMCTRPYPMYAGENNTYTIDGFIR